MNKTVFAAGLMVVIIAAALLLLNVIDSGPAAAIGIVGIGLIGASAVTRRTRL